MLYFTSKIYFEMIHKVSACQNTNMYNLNKYTGRLVIPLGAGDVRTVEKLKRRQAAHDYETELMKEFLELIKKPATRSVTKRLAALTLELNCCITV